MKRRLEGAESKRVQLPEAMGGRRIRGVAQVGEPDRLVISVVTVVLDGANHIQECIDSVLAQSYTNVEHVVIDGGSTDGTLDILRANDDRIAYWESGRDRGIYDAMNRGVCRASGDVIGIVGADDTLYPDSLRAVAAAFAAAPDLDYTYGAVDLVRESGEVFGRSNPVEHAAFLASPYDDMPFCHLSLFVRRDTYRRVGEYDLAFPIRADYDFVLRMLQRECSGRPLEPVLGRYRVGGKSDALSTCFETRRLLQKHGAPALRREWRFLSSLTKVWTVSVLPPQVVRWLKRIVPSRHIFY